MKISIISAYTWYNKGDAAILMGTITELNEFYGSENIEINILTFTPNLDEKKYKSHFKNVNKVKSNIFNPYPVKKTKFNKGIAIFKMAMEYTYYKINKSRLKKLESYKICLDSDLIVICGGGFLGGNKYNSLIHLAQIDLINHLKQPKVLWGTSIEPPTKYMLRKITEKTLSRVNVILPRENVTKSYLNTWYPIENIVNTPDLAFKLENKSYDYIREDIKEIKNLTNKILVGITMREWNFPKSENPEKMKKKYLNSLVETINSLSSTHTFIFVPQVIMFGDDDRLFANLVKSMIQDSNNFIVLEKDYSPYELKNLISNLDQFVGTRMHSNIFCASTGKAPVAIAYEKKTNGIMDKLNLSPYVIDIEDITSRKLLGLIQLNQENQDKLNSQTEESVMNFQNEIRKATILVDKIVNRSI